MNLIGIPHDKVDGVWGRVVFLIEDACAVSGDMVAEDVRKACIAREMQLWTIADDEIYAVAVTEIVNLPQKRVMCGHICTGRDRDRWQHLYEELELWAKSQGCTKVKLIARPGWEKIWKGYKKTHILMEKDL